MSQIYKNNTGGGSGAVDSVTGTYPIIASPTTGNVVVSIDPPVYIHFIANTSIDFTTTGLTTIYTPPPGFYTIWICNYLNKCFRICFRRFF